jgi:hypothetical protein
LVIFACGRADPLESVIFPEMLPYTACARSAPGADRAKATTRSDKVLMDFPFPSV